MGKVLSLLVPKEKKFFDMLEKEAENVLEGVEALSEVTKKSPDLKAIDRKISDIEHKGDDIVHHIFSELNRSFITPIDNEDISRLASSLDDIMDNINDTSRRLAIYGVDTNTDIIKKFIDILHKSCTELIKALEGVRELTNTDKIMEFCIKVNTLENEADDLLVKGLKDLFEGDDPVKMMKLKEIYDFLEEAVDRCEDAVTAIMDIAVKHS